MATGEGIERRGHVTGFKEEISKAAGTRDGFFTWFNSARDADAAVVRGCWDFMFHVGLPITPYLSAPEDKTVLEIGHGGGRMLQMACRSFKSGIGVDIHEENALVEKELHSRGLNNFTLHKSTDGSLVVGDASVDLVYSFIVLPHIEKMNIFCNYLSETARVLKPGGLALLYFGRYSRFSHNRQSAFLYWIDRFLENFLLYRGYREIPARVNEYNLLVTLRRGKREALARGLRTLRPLVSRKNVPDGARRYGSQHGLLLQKM